MALLASYMVLGKVVEIESRAGGPEQEARAAAQVTIGEVALAAAAPAGGGMRATARIAGAGIAAVYAEAMLYDAPSGRLFGPLLREHIRAPREQRSGGLARPVWDDLLEVSYDYRLGLRLLASGEGVTLAFLSPERYPTEGVEAARRLEGEYTLASTGSVRRARLEFAGDGALQRALVFKRTRTGEAPSALTIRAGDAFAPSVLVLQRAAADAWQELPARAGRIVLAGPGLRCTEQPLPAGQVCLGFAVRDVDDRWARRYAAPHPVNPAF